MAVKLFDTISNLLKKKKKEEQAGSNQSASFSSSQNSAKANTQAQKNASNVTWADLNKEYQKARQSGDKDRTKELEQQITEKSKFKSDSASAKKSRQADKKVDYSNKVKGYGVGKDLSDLPDLPSKYIEKAQKNGELKRKAISEAVENGENVGKAIRKTEDKVAKDRTYVDTDNDLYDKLVNTGKAGEDISGGAAKGIVNGVANLGAAGFEKFQSLAEQKAASDRIRYGQAHSIQEAQEKAHEDAMANNVLDSKPFKAITDSRDKQIEQIDELTNDYQDTPYLSDKQKKFISHAQGVAENTTSNLVNMAAGAALGATGIVSPETAGLVTMGIGSYSNAFENDVQKQKAAQAQSVAETRVTQELQNIANRIANGENIKQPTPEEIQQMYLAVYQNAFNNLIDHLIDKIDCWKESVLF